MFVRVSRNAGFCFGVNLAVSAAFNILKCGGRCCTLGAIIHNPSVVEKFEDMGGIVVSNLEDVPKGYKLVIRSHGVSEKVLKQIEASGIGFVDATCPFVKKIHKIVKEFSEAGYSVLIAGDTKHCEVRGIVGHCSGEYFVFKDHFELLSLLKSRILKEKKCIMVAQTTFLLKEWKNCEAAVEKRLSDIKTFDTICRATKIRQDEAFELSKNSEIMIVLGGNNSSNSVKLKCICEKNCKTYFIEKPQNLKKVSFKGSERVGITAGASVPYEDVLEVKKLLDEFKGENMDSEKNIQVNTNQEISAQEGSLHEKENDVVSGEILTGTVTELLPNEVRVDIGRKYYGVVPLTELTTDLSQNTSDLVHVGEKLELAVINFNEATGSVVLSKKQVDFSQGWGKIVDAYNNSDVLTAIVTEVVRGGLKLVCNGIKIFIPASLSGSTRNNPLESFKGKSVEFKVIELDNDRKRGIGSCVAVNAESKKELVENFWNTAKIGDVVEGTVSGLASFGAFVDLGGIEGLIHISEISWNRIGSPADVFKLGQKVRVLIKDINRETGRVSLSYKQILGDPWEIFAGKYKVGQIVTCKITSVKEFGAFAEIMPGVEGMIHVSQISEGRIDNPQDVLAVGDEVRVKIMDMDPVKRRVGLSIRDCYSIS